MAGPWEKYQPQQQTEAGPWSRYSAAPNAFGIDFSRSVPDVRAEIAKLPDANRPEALRQWADAYVTRERSDPNRHNEDFVRNIARGTLVGSFLDEANALTSGAAHSLTGGNFGAPYDEALAYQRATDRAIDTENPALSIGTQIAGGLASATPLVSIPKTLARRTALSAPVGAGHAYVYGAGSDEGDLAQRHEAGLEAAPLGLAIGAVAPSAIGAVSKGVRAAHNYASPTLARLGANARQRFGIHASADGGGPVPPGARAAGEQMLAIDLARSGRAVDDMRNVLAEHERASLYHGPGDPSRGPRGTPGASYAENVMAPVDLSRNWQRLGAAAGRASTEADEIGRTFMTARQTGETPIGRQLEPTSGLPVRPRFARARPDDRPMGQFERERDAFRRAMRISDEEWHGHMATGRQTEGAVVARARQAANENYSAVYKAGEGVDLQPTLARVFANWQERFNREAEPVVKALQRLIGQFGRVRNIEQFDRNKQFLLDAKIENLLKSPVGRNRYYAGVLTEFKDDMLSAIRTIEKNNLGELYEDARKAFSSPMRMRDAYRMGRDAFKEKSEIGAAHFSSLPGQLKGGAASGEQKMFRLGMLDGYTDAAEGMGVGADVTRQFRNKRMDTLLSHVIPRTETPTGRVKIVGGEPAAFSDRPERFGRWLQGEERMIETRDVHGGSQTARNIKDDQALVATNTLSTAIEQFKSSGSLINVGLRFLERVIEKLFGMREDTAKALARMLYTADPVEITTILRRVEARMGPTRVTALAALMQRAAEQSATTIASRQAAAATALPPR